MAQRRFPITDTANSSDIASSQTGLPAPRPTINSRRTRRTRLALDPKPFIVAPPPIPVAAESKQARVVALLRREQGATIADLMNATGWMAHSVRGALSAVVKRKLGLVLQSELEPDRGRVYRIATPPAVKLPRERKGKGKPLSALAGAA